MADVSMPYDLPDGSPSFKSYVNSKNNRFLNPDMASKNRLQPPCKVLHFYNTPPGLTEEDLRKVFQENETAFPAEIRLLQNKSKNSRAWSQQMYLFLNNVLLFHFFFKVRKAHLVTWNSARLTKLSKPSLSATTFLCLEPVRYTAI